MAITVVTAGIQGPPGPAGNGYTYTHNQTTPLMIWSINHNMRKFPHVDLQGVDGVTLRGRVDHVDNTTLTVTYSSPIPGIARLN